jgi:hypothetical protein
MTSLTRRRAAVADMWAHKHAALPPPRKHAAVEPAAARVARLGQLERREALGRAEDRVGGRPVVLGDARGGRTEQRGQLVRRQRRAREQLVQAGAVRELTQRRNDGERRGRALRGQDVLRCGANMIIRLAVRLTLSYIPGLSAVGGGGGSREGLGAGSGPRSLAGRLRSAAQPAGRAAK